MGAAYAGERQRDSVLQSLALNLETWSIQVKREKGVYHMLNKFSVDVTRKILVAEAWTPASARARIQDALRDISDASSSSVSPGPPLAPLHCPLL